MSAQKLLAELEKYLPMRVYGKGPVLELLREMGCFVDKKTPLQVTHVSYSGESREIVCALTVDGKAKATAALTNLKLDITHPMFRKVRDYRAEVAMGEAPKDEKPDVNKSTFRVGSLYGGLERKK